MMFVVIVHSNIISLRAPSAFVRASHLLRTQTASPSASPTVNNKNVLFYKGKNYIPMNDDLRRDIAKMFHDHEMAGHPRELETFNSIRNHYWWPGLRTFIKNYIKGCGTCQQFKIDRQPSKPAYIPTEGSKST
jgi:hypothetical protein